MYHIEDLVCTIMLDFRKSHAVKNSSSVEHIPCVHICTDEIQLYALPVELKVLSPWQYQN